ncbi:GTPase IMAP family member 7-like [Siphateles boraxobius]|uniref:GTPase IMAP family member 7-like n=1 Tax=Siphateles boraxobius TaxID=180520 RepID=UPI004062BDF5
MGNDSSLPKRNIVLIGNSGNGKSSAGNTILRKKEFTTKVSANSVTTEFQRSENTVNGKMITVVDTPDFFDTHDDDKMKSEIIRAMVGCAEEGIHAFVIVLKVGRYTTHEKKILPELLKKLLDLLKENVLKHTVILFTHGEQLEENTIKEFIEDCPQLQELVDKCGGRCHVIDNTYWNKRKPKNKSNNVQVKNLLDTIDQMENENGCYTNELLKKMEEEIQKRIKKNREKPKNNGYRIIQDIALRGAFMGSKIKAVEVVERLTEACTEPFVGKMASSIIGAGVGGALDAVADEFIPQGKGKKGHIK